MNAHGDCSVMKQVRMVGDGASFETKLRSRVHFRKVCI